LGVYFSDGAEGHPATVWAIRFLGKREAEPPGIPNLLAFTRQDLVMRYGLPTSESDGGENTRYLYFQNGLITWLDRADKVMAYGVYTTPQ
jgi:hypothetical protein